MDERGQERTVETLERTANGRTWLVVTLDNPPVNATSETVRADLLAAFEAIDARPTAPDGVVIAGRNDAFVGGADIREFGKAPAEPTLSRVLAAVEACPVPVVAAIDGPALGGGYELALVCDGRVATARSIIGLPEVTLGMIPGAGGTVRLPRLVGVAEAIALVTSGSRIGAEKALSLGMIDAIAEDDVVEAACALLERLEGHKARLLDRPVPDSAEGAVGEAEKAARKKARGSNAVAAAIDAVKDAARLPVNEALERERRTSLDLRHGEQAAALRHLFFAERAAGSRAKAAKPLPVAKVGVVGAGQMGRGIALAFATRGFDVRLCDASPDALAGAVDHLRKAAESMEAAGRMPSASKIVERISTGEVASLGDCDLVIEAIIEDMDAKKALIGELDTIVRSEAILASNTSYLDVDAIAASSAHPGRVAGMHFFNPAHVMRLVEVVHGAASTPETIATLMTVCKKLGKVAVPAGVGEGFIGNRIFSAYRRQCEYLLEDGAYPEDIDAAMRDFGMAMGPFAVFDLAGLEIAWATRKRLAPTRDPRERYVVVADRLCEAGRFGRKAGKGWYAYDEAGKPVPDPEVRTLIEEASAEKGIIRRPFSSDEIRTRLLATMVSEACLILDDGIAERAGDIDLVLVNGYGFPRLAGGPLFWAARQPREAMMEAIDGLTVASGLTARHAENLESVLDEVSARGRRPR
ncbi:3-hydroxyacyl-CoA dehydrogenase NAD-binding domain-containing protein [Pararhizobium mangrovi]|uniref:3-hydroxyacyl-CoA dehydrogenase n=1 Tax=Pararhizobium mangrovi TaxID=2590452 RepID=A0A506TZ76_9HYPH|nr:3-hydroxyacyl-CoA dehydrogenase NAD-binding domain-containing protein [Pararhizobium mangrovi]TPW26291.1 3-hydroxyacyl-CoA dehydrogenase [Pararhizobium mangrovi]